MRVLIAGIFIAISASGATAADKNEDKAKEVTVAFLNALKAKDLDAVMKAVDTPFAIEMGGTPKTFEKTDELKAAMTKFLEKVTPDKIPTEVGTVHDMTSLAKFAKEKGADGLAESTEKLVGKTGYMVMMKAKDGTARNGAVLRSASRTAKHSSRAFPSRTHRIIRAGNSHRKAGPDCAEKPLLTWDEIICGQVAHLACPDALPSARVFGKTGWRSSSAIPSTPLVTVTTGWRVERSCRAPKTWKSLKSARGKTLGA